MFKGREGSVKKNQKIFANVICIWPLIGTDLLGALHGYPADGPLVVEVVSLDLGLRLVPEVIRVVEISLQNLFNNISLLSVLCRVIP